MAGLKCGNCNHGVYIPDDDPNVPLLKTPSATVQCPNCGLQMECAEAWVRYEAWDAEQRKGGILLGERAFEYQYQQGYGGPSPATARARPPLLTPYHPPPEDDPVILIRRGGRTIKRGGAR